MRTGISITVSPADRARLAALVRDRNTPQKHVWRAEIVLLSADDVGTVEIMRLTGKSKTCVWRWQESFAAEGIEGLLRDKTRPSRIPPLGPEVAERIVALTLGDPPGETTHWTADMMAEGAGISASAVRRIWRAHGLQPHRWGVSGDLCKKLRRRGQIESQLGQLQRAIGRLWADYESERVPVDIAGPRLKDMQAHKVALQAELAQQPEVEKIVGLHPAALRHYEEQVSCLRSVFGEGVTPNTQEAADNIRSLVAQVTVHPRQDGFSIELQGRLAMLIGAPNVYPNMRLAASGGTVVAEEGLEPPTRGL